MDGKLVIRTEISNKKVNAQIKELEHKIKTNTKKLESNSDVKVAVHMNQQEKLKLESDIEKMKNKLNSLKGLSLKNSMSSVKNIEFSPNKIGATSFSTGWGGFDDSSIKLQGDLPYIAKNMKDLKIETANVNTETKKFGEHASDSFSKGNKSLKRFALSLFSLGSIYALVSKASSSYMSNDLELSKKLQSVWVGLGSFLAPAIEYISDLLLKGLGYLNEFVYALTGIDFIANANAKALEKQAKAQKNLNNQTFSFDEMNIAQSTSSSSSSSGSSNLIQIPELDQDLVKKLQDLALWLKENWNWISKVGIALGVTFGVAKLAGLVSNIGKLLGGKSTGLIGLKGMLVGLAAAYTIYLYMKGYKEIKEGLDDLNSALKSNTEMQQSVTESSQKLSNKFWDLVKSGDASAQQIDMFKNNLDKSAKGLIEQSQAIDDSQLKIFGWTIKNKEATKQQEELAKQLLIATDDYYAMYEAGLITKEELDDFASNTLVNVIRKLEENGASTDELKEKYRQLTGQNYNVTVKATLKDEVTWKLKEILKNSEVSLAFGLGVNSITNQGKRFARGDIVTQPTRAVIGEAGYPEAILPLTDGYLSTLADLISSASNNKGNGNSVTNIYLDSRLIQRQIRRANEDLAFATNG